MTPTAVNTRLVPSEASSALPFALLASVALHLVILIAPIGDYPSTHKHSRSEFSPRPGARLPLKVIRMQASRTEAPLPDLTLLAPPEPIHPGLIDPQAMSGFQPPVGVIPRFFDYLKASDLTTAPGLHTLGPVEPKDADRILGAGKIVIELFINEAGIVDAVDVVEDAAPPSFRDHVVRVFGNARYTPGRIADKPVKSRFKVEVSLAPLTPPPGIGMQPATGLPPASESQP